MSPKTPGWRIVPRQILTSLAQLIRIAEIPKWWSSTSRLFAFTALLAITIYVWILLALRLSRYGSPGWRLTYERITNLPSGLSSIFPLLFLWSPRERGSTPTCHAASTVCRICRRRRQLKKAKRA